MKTRWRKLAVYSAEIIFMLVCGGSSVSQPPSHGQPFRLWEFDEVGHTCRSKGRLQDKDSCDSRMVDSILARGKEAIPILISELTDVRPTREPVWDFWTKTTAGDIANAILVDLFTDQDQVTFTLPDLQLVRSPVCPDAAEVCWRRLLERRGRKFVQDQWIAAWNRNKDRVYWDAKAQCFRVGK